jgi:hypothetical protein
MDIAARRQTDPARQRFATASRAQITEAVDVVISTMPACRQAWRA